ncbi:MAG: hypothetical protein ACR2IT_02860 [Pirellulales bacterium]
MRPKLLAGGALVGLIFGVVAGAALGHFLSKEETYVSDYGGGYYAPAYSAMVIPYAVLGGMLTGTTLGMTGGCLIAELQKQAKA